MPWRPGLTPIWRDAAPSRPVLTTRRRDPDPANRALRSAVPADGIVDRDAPGRLLSLCVPIRAPDRAADGITGRFPRPHQLPRPRHDGRGATPLDAKPDRVGPLAAIAERESEPKVDS